MPVVDAVATRAADRSAIYLKVVNTDPVNAMNTGIELRGQEVEPAGVWHVLTAETLQAHNSFTTPNAVRPSGGGPIAAGRRFDLLLPPRSVSVIVLRGRPGR